MKPIKRPIHTLRKAVSKLKAAIRTKASDAGSPAWDAEIAHYRQVALRLAKTEQERATINSL